METSKNNIKKYLNCLQKEKIETWFDLGLFLDRIRENRKIPQKRFFGTYEDFKRNMCKNDLAFLTYQYSIDGVSIEVEKYAKIFHKKFNDSTIHYIAGKLFAEAVKIIPSFIKVKEIESLQGFDDWNLYHDFFFTKLQRGSKEYNQLIKKFWNQTLNIFQTLGNYILDNNIKLLYLINVCSNPGNVSFSLAVVLLSELLGIPVINNNHDFYWEGGNSEIDKLTKHIPDGPRDFFFTNSHIGEFFSIIEMLYPWQSRIWINVNINKQQSEHLIIENGHNPANVTEIGTAIDTSQYENRSKRKKINTFNQFEKILSRYSDTLISYSAKDVLESELVSRTNPKPILIGARKTETIDKFLTENIIFLQPTRIISRKRIEIGFSLIEKLFLDNNFYKRFSETKHLKLTIIITGPIAAGHYQYLQHIVRKFNDLLNSLNEDVKNKIYLAFLFSEIDKPEFKRRFENSVGIPELYNIASLILLPSKTEGRGLPIIEAAACGTPIFCSRYYPENVYSEVIGEHLPHKDRLKVIEFDGKNITKKHITKIIERVFYPHKFSDEIEHNYKVVEKRYSLNSLSINVDDICYTMYRQTKSNRRSVNSIKRIINDYTLKCKFKNHDFNEIIKAKNREYLPGFGRLRFMIMLKSLIDPSYFRVEEQKIKGIAYSYALKLIEKIDTEISKKRIIHFLNTVETIFLYKEGEVNIQHDHSFPYRYRNKNYYPYQDFTIQEISGLINYLFHNIIKPKFELRINASSHFFTDFDLALSQLTSSVFLAIDNRQELIRKLQSNAPIAYFPGKYIKNELEFFALQSVRSRLELDITEELTENILDKNYKYISPIYILASKYDAIDNYKSNTIRNFIVNSKDDELKLLYQYNIIQVIDTEQWCVGIHFNQIGENALRILRYVKNEKGFIISNRKDSAVMTDIVDIDKFHIGKVEDSFTESLMGIPKNSGYVQFVPAGLRSTLSYPTPIQTANDFNDIFKSEKFKDLQKRIGKEKLFKLLKDDAETKMSSLNEVLDNISNTENKQDVIYNSISGVYSDGLPWSGIIATAKTSENSKWNFIIQSSITPKRVTDFINSCIENIEIAWNGGYILNAELVGKLGLPETYIGSPLGLLISDKNMLSAPLFNKPALIFRGSKISIEKVSSSVGISVSRGTNRIEFPHNQYNTNVKNVENSYFDLMYEKEEIETHGKVLVRLAGNTIKEILRTTENQKTKLIPVGLTLLVDPKIFPKEWKVGDQLTINVKGLDDINYAVEAGPLLVSNGKIVLDMEEEGWKTKNSIRTQAARLDYTDMRGPKIAAGIDKYGNLVVLTINGRIRESVGATHYDMAEILKKLEIQTAMGFDPGGSSTLVVNGKTLNISPYNSNYEKNIYSLPPEPRAVSNVILGYIKK